MENIKSAGKSAEELAGKVGSTISSAATTTANGAGNVLNKGVDTVNDAAKSTSKAVGNVADDAKKAVR